MCDEMPVKTLHETFIAVVLEIKNVGTSLPEVRKVHQTVLDIIHVTHRVASQPLLSAFIVEHLLITTACCFFGEFVAINTNCSLLLAS